MTVKHRAAFRVFINNQMKELNLETQQGSDLISQWLICVADILLPPRCSTTTPDQVGVCKLCLQQAVTGKLQLALP